MQKLPGLSFSNLATGIARALVQPCLDQSSIITCPQRHMPAVVIEILDTKGAVLNTYSSETPVLRPGRGGAAGANMPGVGTAGPESQPDPDAAPTRRFSPPPRVTKTAGINRFAWDVRNQAGVTLPPGQYQVRLKTGGANLHATF